MKVARSFTGIAAAAAAAVALAVALLPASLGSAVAIADEKPQIALIHVEDMT